MSEQESENDVIYDFTHDTFFKEMFKMRRLAIAFLKKYLRPETLAKIDLERLTIEAGDFVDDSFHTTHSDMIYRVPIIRAKGDVSFHIITEHKSHNDFSTIFQIWKYIHLLCVKEVENRLTYPETQKRKSWTKDFRLSPIIPIILHHGSTPFTGEIELSKLFHSLPGAEEFLPHQKAILVDLTTMKDEDIPRDAEVPELHIVLMIMNAVFMKTRETQTRKISEIFVELAPYSEIPLYNKLIRQFWYYAINNAKKLTRTDVKELETEIREITGEKVMSSVAQSYMKEGFKKGMKQGKAEGIAEGKAKGIAEGKAEMLLFILTKRFRVVPESLETRVFAITDLSRLEKLADFALDCESLDEFAVAVK